LVPLETDGIKEHAPMDEKTITAHMTREEGYRLQVSFEGLDGEPLVVDEPPPLGEDTGPNATQLLAAAVGTCLSHSLTFCLQRSRTELESLDTEVTVKVGRNNKGRLRIQEMRVVLSPILAPAPDGDDGKARSKLDRCKQLFQDFCTVSTSLEGAFPIHVSVAEPAVRN
jgi:organic hydroperoxide reductase OsmC/OhrA